MITENIKWFGFLLKVGVGGRVGVGGGGGLLSKVTGMGVGGGVAASFFHSLFHTHFFHVVTDKLAHIGHAS